MGSSVAAEKSVWEHGNWDFVGAQASGSRVEQIKIIKEFLQADSNEPLVLCLEGVWGIGKSSLVTYAAGDLPPGQKIPYVLHIGCDRDALSPTKIIGFLEEHSQESVLVIIRVMNGNEDWQSYLEVIRGSKSFNFPDSNGFCGQSA